MQVDAPKLPKSGELLAALDAYAVAIVREGREPSLSCWRSRCGRLRSGGRV